MRKAYELKPGDASVVMELARHLFSAGREHSDLGRSVSEMALQADPLNPLNWVQRSWTHYTTGRLAEAEQATQRAIELSDPGNPARTYAAYGLVIGGRRPEAIALLDQVASAVGNTVYGSLSAFLARALQGDAPNAVGHVTATLEQSAHWVEYLAWFLANGYALIGRRDDALRWLRETVDRGFINYPVLARLDPSLESIRGDAEYKALMQQVERRWRAFEV